MAKNNANPNLMHLEAIENLFQGIHNELNHIVPKNHTQSDALHQVHAKTAEIERKRLFSLRKALEDQ